MIVIGPKPLSDNDYSLYELICPKNLNGQNNGCSWRTLNQTVARRGTGHASFLVIDDGNFNCTEIH